MQFTVILYGDISYEPGGILIERVEAGSPAEAAKLAEQRATDSAYGFDDIRANAVFAGWHDDLLPDDYGMPGAGRGEEE
jgi:hypothetical protein